MGNTRVGSVLIFHEGVALVVYQNGTHRTHKCINYRPDGSLTRSVGRTFKGDFHDPPAKLRGCGYATCACAYYFDLGKEITSMGSNTTSSIGIILM